eukprot:NODE_41_length_34096_cov_2.002235.p30 type:complete len:119 gc:universal NODE_41_length_34096_cov_2.002235:14860-14504(-)
MSELIYNFKSYTAIPQNGYSIRFFRYFSQLLNRIKVSCSLDMGMIDTQFFWGGSSTQNQVIIRDFFIVAMNRIVFTINFVNFFVDVNHLYVLDRVQNSVAAFPCLSKSHYNNFFHKFS